MISFGNKNVTSLSVGGNSVVSAYFGDKKIWPTMVQSGTVTTTVRVDGSDISTWEGIGLTTYSIGFKFDSGTMAIDWGDNSSTVITVNNQDASGVYEHKYSNVGTYTVKYTFTDTGNLSASGSTIRESSLKRIDDFNIKMHYLENLCYNRLGLEYVDPEIFIKSETINVSGAFANCVSLKSPASDWGYVRTASYAYKGCIGMTGSVPEWGDNILFADFAYKGCTGLTGTIPAWGANILDARFTYEDCAGLTACSSALLLNPMPAWITSHSSCVTGCVDNIRKHFTADWGGTKAS